MLKGAKRLKVSGILLMISALFAISLYMIMLSALLSGPSASEVFATHDSPDPNRGIGYGICIVALFHFYKLIVGILTVYRAETTECKGITGNSVLVLMLTVFGVVIIITSITDGVKASSDLEMLRFVVLIVLGVVDIVLLIETLIGTTQNSKGITAEQDQP